MQVAGIPPPSNILGSRRLTYTLNATPKLTNFLFVSKITGIGPKQDGRKSSHWPTRRRRQVCSIQARASRYVEDSTHITFDALTDHQVNLPSERYRK